ncbi:MAG TPA: AIR synthase family protein [Chloroflexota bacterium]|nr:AIR synthase family protein [Chloroflexota bacterium]
MREIGKIAGSTFQDVIQPRLGAARPDVRVGPTAGVDAGIVDVGGGRVMAVTTDPLFVMPALGWERAAWFAVQIVASDLATSGFPPAYLSIDLNLPPEMPDADLASLWEAVHETCHDLGIAIVTGHTGRYDGCSFPMLGGVTVWAFGETGAYVTPAFAAPGDDVIATKGPAIEATAFFGILAPDLLRDSLGADIAAEAASLFGSLTVVPDAMAAVSAGVRARGVTSLHDATERGVLGGLAEIVHATSAGMVVHQDALPVPPAVRAVCDLTGMDPFSASSEGTLLLTCRPGTAGAIIARLDDAGIPAFRIGELLPPESGATLITAGGEMPLEEPAHDPFWPALVEAIR